LQGESHDESEEDEDVDGENKKGLILSAGKYLYKSTYRRGLRFDAERFHSTGGLATATQGRLDGNGSSSRVHELVGADPSSGGHADVREAGVP
jgi:hypothetical protein